LVTLKAGFTTHQNGTAAVRLAGVEYEFATPRRKWEDVLEIAMRMERNCPQKLSFQPRLMITRHRTWQTVTAAHFDCPQK